MKGGKLITDFYELKVHQLMDRRVWDLPIITEEEDISNVLNILGVKNHIWVVKNKKDKKLVGVITEHDVLSILTPKHLPAYVFGMPDVRSIQYGTANKVKDIMSHKVITCSPDEKVIDALAKMMKNRLRRLPVVEDGRLIGELTLSQLIRKYYAAMRYYPIVDDKK